MGNVICGRDKKSRIESQPSVLSPGGGSDGKEWSLEDLDEQRMEQLLLEMKLYHQNRLRLELETDPHGFILDNLLMCVQFFDNFDHAVDEANKVRWKMDRELTELLAKDPLEGTILGDRRVKLLTGMSHVLAQNYIYRGKKHDETDDADLYYGGIGFKDTFMADGILPLDFSMTWDNLELYDISELSHLKEYSDAKGASPIAQFCMEQPDKKTNFPKGYVRLRCVDEPIPFRRKLDTPPIHPLETQSNFDYEPAYRQESVYSVPDDAVPEVDSESDEHHSRPTSEDEDDATDLPEMLRAMPRLKNPMSPKGDRSFFPSSQQPGPSNAKPFRPKLQLNIPPNKSNEQPSFVVHAPTPPVPDASLEMEHFQNPNTDLLYPRLKPGKILNQSRSSDQSSPRDSPAKEAISSGYESLSTISRSSSMASEMVRDKWQKLNLKKLWEFGKKSRKEFIVPNGKYDPIPPNCYSEIKYEFSIDDPIEEEDEEDEGLDDDESDITEDGFSLSSTSRKLRRRKTVEDEYELRFYLNSLQFSSNACSEFHFIAPKMNIPMSSLANGVVLGTTIRCPILYNSAEENENDEEGKSISERYYVTYTFTPSIHSKTWPDGLDDKFYLYVRSQAMHDNLLGEKWPSRTQMEQIEELGCSAIPLGFRSMDFFNAEQFLEWELNFHDCEVNLLNSFRYPHWKAYILAAILFRAFIAPLGPQGIGLEHVRNVLYFMCHENFSGWEDEQSGLHLRILLDNLYHCLSKSSMPSFFVRSRNLLQSIPQQNLRFVQGHLKQIRENLIVYSIYAFRNIVDVRKEKDSYPLPDFKKLYEMLTVQEAGLIKIMNPMIRMHNDQEEKRKSQKQKKKNKKRRKPNLLDQQDSIDKDFFVSEKERLGMSQPPPKRDRVNERLWNRYNKYLREMEEHERKVREMEKEKQKKDPEQRIPLAEKRKSIDLKKFPIVPERFTPFRLLIIIQFFIKHFIEMAQKAVDLHNFSQAAMYVLQVENLCEIVGHERFKEVSSPFQDDDLDSYRQETLRLRAILGKDMNQYILSRLSQYSPSQTPAYSTLTRSQYSLDPGSPISKNMPLFINNWDLRKLPTPPQSEKDIQTPGKKLERPNIVRSLQSFRNTTNQIQNGTSIPTIGEDTGADSAPKLPTDANRAAARRQESIKFVSSVVPKETPPATPPRSEKTTRRIPMSRMSTISLTLDVELEESTDL